MPLLCRRKTTILLIQQWLWLAYRHLFNLFSLFHWSSPTVKLLQRIMLRSDSGAVAGWCRESKENKRCISNKDLYIKQKMSKGDLFYSVYHAAKGGYHSKKKKKVVNFHNWGGGHPKSLTFSQLFFFLHVLIHPNLQ